MTQDLEKLKELNQLRQEFKKEELSFENLDQNNKKRIDYQNDTKKPHIRKDAICAFNDISFLKFYVSNLRKKSLKTAYPNFNSLTDLQPPFLSLKDVFTLFNDLDKFFRILILFENSLQNVSTLNSLITFKSFTIVIADDILKKSAREITTSNFNEFLKEYRTFKTEFSCSLFDTFSELVNKIIKSLDDVSNEDESDSDIDSQEKEDPHENKETLKTQKTKQKKNRFSFNFNHGEFFEKNEKEENDTVQDCESRKNDFWDKFEFVKNEAHKFNLIKEKDLKTLMYEKKDDNIKKAYRRICIYIHPDKCPNNKKLCEDFFVEIQKPYDKIDGCL